jgi:FkbH-like protein
MKLIEALTIANRQQRSDATSRRFALVCGFTPLHLLTFLKAYLQTEFPADAIEITTGLYGDLPGNLDRLQQQDAQSAAVVVEWSDLDPRLGMRDLGGWRPSVLPDILMTVSTKLQQIELAIRRASQSSTIALSIPTLPLPPCFARPGWVESGDEAELRERVASFARGLADASHVNILNQQRLQQVSPAGDRYDLRADLHSGYPYKHAHTDALAALLAKGMAERQPLKGLISDLDDTMWRGLLGEIGVESIAWDLGGQAQIHGLYQQALAMLADRGVLVAIATKNDPKLVGEALARRDFHIPQDRIFPVQAGWGPKSDSVREILRSWNIGPDAVMFIDDNAMELGEVKFAFPEIECHQFPTTDIDAFPLLLETLRDRFSKRGISAEDEIRVASLKAARGMPDQVEGAASSEAFLQLAEATVVTSFHGDPSDARAFELVNKTNQFNLNGERLSHREWEERLARPDWFLATVSYRDKFGPLGKIAVLMGTVDAGAATLRVDTWVMSCRAFSRRVEYQLLRQLFDRFDAREIVFQFKATPRNGPLRDFLATFGEPRSDFRLTREQFATQCPPLYHACEEAVVG